MDLKIYEVPEGEKRAGMWTFSIDGRESLWYSTREDSVKRKVTRLLKASVGKVRLAPMIANASAISPAALKKEQLKRIEESTLEGFMRRGKLAES